MTEIYVDADACPVKDEVLRVAERHGFAVHMVANSFMRLPASPLVQRVVVSEGADAADDWIAERIGEADIAITADIPLAARCIARGARVVGPTGKALTTDSIGMTLAMRNLMADLRESGDVGASNPPFTRADRSKFLMALEDAVQAILRGK